MTTNSPSHLSDEAREWWDNLTAEYGIEDEAGRLLLQSAMEAFDRVRDAQAAITRDGVTVADRFGQIKNHPMLTAERDARAQMLTALKQLNLDVEPLRDAPGRPPEGNGWTGPKSVGGK